MDFQKILENKPLLYAIIGGAAFIVLLLFITIGVVASSGSHSANKANPGKTVTEEPIKEDVDLLTTDNLGKAIEIQALLARYNISVSRALDGTKSRLYLKKGDCTTGMKKCTTAKKIRLTRAVNGELSRLIRKIKPIENASVFISIPEQTMFTSQQKPVTATVQVVIPSGEKLEPLKIKAITNLLLGSVSGLENENISITDTNGNVYHSVINASDELLAKIEENDKYMQQKVMQQLDRLIGKGNYVATVSTFLREAPAEKYSTLFDPNSKTSVNEQSFTEGLGDQTQDTNSASNAVSVYLPNGMANANNNSSQNRSYSRQATETQYGVSKTQLNEYLKPGMIEEVTVAVTLERSAIPPDTTLQELKQLVASAAGPKVDVDNVSIAFSDTVDPYLASGRQANLPKPDESGNPWWLAVVLSAIGLIIVFRAVSNRVRQIQEENALEVERLRQKESEQDREISDVNMRTTELENRQSELAQGLIEQQQREYIGERSEADMIEALSKVSSDLAAADAEIAGDKIKSWIENS